MEHTQIHAKKKKKKKKKRKKDVTNGSLERILLEDHRIRFRGLQDNVTANPLMCQDMPYFCHHEQ